jgi:hypothetical protein
MNKVRKILLQGCALCDPSGELGILRGMPLKAGQTGVYKDLVGRTVTRRRQPRLVRWRTKVPGKDGDAFYYQQLILNVPFRDERRLLSSNNSMVGVDGQFREECVLRGVCAQSESSLCLLQRMLAGTKNPAVAGRLRSSIRLLEGVNGSGSHKRKWEDADESSGLGGSVSVENKLSYPRLTATQKQVVYGIVNQQIHDKQTQAIVVGGGGSGKTSLVRYLVDVLQSAGFKVGIVAPSGCAATLYRGGMTCHSFFGLQCDLELKKGDRSVYTHRLRELDFLFVDECGMVTDTLCDAMERELRRVRCNNEPWGGVSVCFTGDPLQLPPVIDKEDTVVGNAHTGEPFWCSSRVRETFQHYVLEGNKRVVTGDEGVSDF